MNVLLINGSPRPHGNTSIALGKEAYGLPQPEPRVATHFIR